MVATLLRLKYHLVIADMKRSVGRVVLFVFFALYCLMMVFIALVGFGAASEYRTGNEHVVASITTFVGSLVIAGWTILPLLFFGVDQTLDPARFRPFPLRGSRLAPGLVLAGVIGLPGLVTAVLCLGVALLWLGHGAVFVGLIAGSLGFLMSQVGCRLATTALSGTLSSRKMRDLTGVIALIVILVLSTGGYVVSMGLSLWSSRAGGGAATLATVEQIAGVLAWTPLGSPWAILGAAGQGQWGMSVVFLVLTCCYLGLGIWGYGVVLDRAMLAPDRVSSARVMGSGNIIDAVSSWPGLSGRLAGMGAIMGRCLRYWRRDPRYLGQLPAVLMMPVLFTIMGLTMPLMVEAGGDEVPLELMGFMSNLSLGLIAFGLGFAAVMAGYTLSADLAYDSTAWWIHLTSGVRGWQDRLGRVLASVVVMGPLVLVVGIAVPWFLYSGSVVPNVVGAMIVLYAAGLGVSSIFSAWIVYPVALPGESPLKMRTGMMGAQMLSQFGSLTIAGLLALPVCLWAIVARGWMSWIVLAVGVVWGGILMAAGVFLGGKLTESRGPTILSILMKNDSKDRN
ncbi:MAG: hypothetical protein FWG08_06335 [Propionibacteriaceae bacterium]|nr:hypothetical protein [Propionibacteriaceae bacterium]